MGVIGVIGTVDQAQAEIIEIDIAGTFGSYSLENETSCFYKFDTDLKSLENIENITITTNDVLIFNTDGFSDAYHLLNQGHFYYALTNHDDITLGFSSHHSSQTLKTELAIGKHIFELIEPDEEYNDKWGMHEFGKRELCNKNRILEIIVIEPPNIKKLESKLDTKTEVKNKWKDRYNICFDKKENLKSKIENITSEFNQYKLDMVDNENQYTQLLQDHETQITNLQGNLTNANFEIDKLKQEKADLIKQVETLESQLQEN